MMEYICNLIGALSDKQVDVTLAMIGFASAFIVAVVGLFGSALTIMLNKWHERKVELRKIKESHYIDFLGSIAEAKVTKENEQQEINKLLSVRIQTIYLIGNKDVQRALSDFLNIIITGKGGCGHFFGLKQPTPDSFCN